MSTTPSLVTYTPVTLTAPPPVVPGVTLPDTTPAALTVITGPRVEGWQLDAITPAGAILATLPVVKDSGQHDWQLDRDNPLGLSCTIADRMPDGSALPDLRGMWLRATHRINGIPYLLATVVVAGAPRTLTASTSTLKLSGIDPTVLLARAKLRKALTLPVATPVAETARSLIAVYTPLVRASIGDSDETLRTNVTFDAGTPILEIVNTLLAAAAYTQLAPLPDGTLVSTPWMSTATRGTTLTFNDTNGALFLPGMDFDDDYLAAPNEVLAIGKGGQDLPTVVGRWPDAPPSNPVTEVIQTDATGIETARMQAREHFEAKQASARRASFIGPWQPIRPGQVARFNYTRHDVNARFELTALRTDWRTGSPTTYSIQEAS